MTHYIEFNGKMYQVQVCKEANDFETVILDNGKIITSINSETPALDESVKEALQSKFKDKKVLELTD